VFVIQAFTVVAQQVAVRTLQYPYR